MDKKALVLSLLAVFLSSVVVSASEAYNATYDTEDAADGIIDLMGGAAAGIAGESVSIGQLLGVAVILAIVAMVITRARKAGKGLV